MSPSSKFIDRVLLPPSYGWTKPDGSVVVPTTRQLFAEAFSRMNIFRSRKNWLAFSNWFWSFTLAPFFILFFFFHFKLAYLFIGFIYGMVLMGSYGTVWLHRYGTHGAFTFSNRFWRFITANLVIKVVPEEIYIISHHVHHARSDEPGDPYNASAGGLYCFLADTNHQPIATDLSPKDYARVCKLLAPTGMKQHTYEQYLKWGSVASPLRTSLHFLFSRLFWYGAFYLIGGHALATAMFCAAWCWAVGIRTFNYSAHGSGQDRRRDGIDFNRADMSINQLWPGFVAGEWHNNHHLFAASARNGFLWYQLDLPFLYIRLLSLLGGIESYRDHTELFFNVKNGARLPPREPAEKPVETATAD